MADTQRSSQTPSPTPSDTESASRLDLSRLPPLTVCPTHFAQSDLDDSEERLTRRGAILSYACQEIGIVLTRVETKRRALFDLRTLGISTEEVVTGSGRPSERDSSDRAAKRVKKSIDYENGERDTRDDLNTPSDYQDSETQSLPGQDERDGTASILAYLSSSTIKVIKISWMDECLRKNQFLPPWSYIIYEGSRSQDVEALASQRPQTPPHSSLTTLSHSPGDAILARAIEDAHGSSPRQGRDFGARKFGERSRSTLAAPYAAGLSKPTRPVHLLHETTSEHEGEAQGDTLPPAPDWVINRVQYSCQRSTPAQSPNDAFIDQLKEIRLARLLTDDEIGVRAYSSAIAAIAAYPHKLSSKREVIRLPCSDGKIAQLWEEYATTGTVEAAQAAKNDPEMKTLRLFYDIWGVGATTARDFYFQRGWRDLDDVVEYGWSTLSRVQQIGVKFYEEFKTPVPRAEVEDIAAIVHLHAVKVRDERIQSLLVGGHRRGKDASGDVDLIVSHPDEEATKGLITDIVASLEDEGWITHTLLLALTATHRDQQTLPFRAQRTGAAAAGGSGFDSLDKALVVWRRDPDRDRDAGAAAPSSSSPSSPPPPHRRVDIIVSPWRTVGCAVLGWSGATTFQRDVRRYAKNERGWKFDSSGIRDRGSGRVVDAEGYHYYHVRDRRGRGGPDDGTEFCGSGVVAAWSERATSMVQAEKRVFETLGLEWQDPENRCTG